jgi:hypothetical protein
MDSGGNLPGMTSSSSRTLPTATNNAKPIIRMPKLDVSNDAIGGMKTGVNPLPDKSSV